MPLPSGPNSDYRTGLIDIEPSLRRQNTDIENRRPETGAQNLSDAARNSEISPSETLQCPANSRENHEYFFDTDVPHRDGTGWLGRQDSNRRMLLVDVILIHLKYQRNLKRQPEIPGPERLH